MARYTQKQIDKFNRQKYITELEKIAKNLFRMLRDESVDAVRFISKFETLKKSFDERETTHLDVEYHKQLKAYIERLYDQTCKETDFSDNDLENMREAEMSNLNRLQKLKNGNSYKKDKHKSKHRHEDWG